MTPSTRRLTPSTRSSTHPRRRWTPILALAAALAVPGALSGCSDSDGGDGGGSDPGGACESGETRSCVGPAGCSGGQSCVLGGWSVCDCGGSPAASGGSGGAAGGGGNGGGGAGGGGAAEPEAYICSSIEEDEPGFLIDCVPVPCESEGWWLEGGPYSSMDSCRAHYEAVRQRAMDDGFAGGAEFGLDDLHGGGDFYLECDGEVASGFAEPSFIGAIAAVYPEGSGVAIALVTDGSFGAVTSPDSGWLVIGLDGAQQAGSAEVVPMGLEGWPNPIPLSPGEARIYYANEATEVSGTLELLSSRVTVTSVSASLQIEMEFDGLTVESPAGVVCQAYGTYSLSGQADLVEPHPGDGGGTDGSGGSGSGGSGGTDGSGGSGDGDLADACGEYTDGGITDVQAKSFCQTAYAYTCAGNDAAVASTCSTLRALSSDAASKCPYC